MTSVFALFFFTFIMRKRNQIFSQMTWYRFYSSTLYKVFKFYKLQWTGL